MSSLKANVLIVSAVLGLEVFSGVGLIGLLGFPIGLILMLRFLSDRAGRRATLRSAVVYLGVALATLGLIDLNFHVAKRRAEPLIAACDNFRAKHQRYPDYLSELVPEYLASIPAAKYTVMGRAFGYDKERPSIYFLVMFHGVAYYDFQTRTWKSNE